jgi:hypothetical protein
MAVIVLALCNFEKFIIQGYLYHWEDLMVLPWGTGSAAASQKWGLAGM